MVIISGVPIFRIFMIGSLLKSIYGSQFFSSETVPVHLNKCSLIKSGDIQITQPLQMMILMPLQFVHGSTTETWGQ